MNCTKKLKNTATNPYNPRLSRHPFTTSETSSKSVLHPEHILIPYQLSQLPAGPWLVFAPHADDETYGMGGTLLKARDERVETHLVVVTDGAMGGDSKNLVSTREKEVREAANALGVKTVQCWYEPDRGLVLNRSVIDKAMRAVTELSVVSVFFPGPLEIHPDHRATALLVWAALQKLSNGGHPVTAYAYEISTQNPVNHFVDITSQRAAKEEVMAIYASQNCQNNYQDLTLALNKARTFSLPVDVNYAEGFYQFSEEELRLPLIQVTHNIIDLYLC